MIRDLPVRPSENRHGELAVIHCKNCLNWIDENLEQIVENTPNHPHIFMGCRIFGDLQGIYQLESCRHYIESKDLFTICNTCKITVPKICVSMGECVNCTDTDLFCVDSCIGDDSRKYCTHFVRLHSEGIHLIEDNRVFDLFPKKGMPGKK